MISVIQTVVNTHYLYTSILDHLHLHIKFFYCNPALLICNDFKIRYAMGGSI